MGHADLATAMGYTHLVDEDLLALVKVSEDGELKPLAEVRRVRPCPECVQSGGVAVLKTRQDPRK